MNRTPLHEPTLAPAVTRPQHALAFAAGAVFAAGLVLSGMTRPDKVLAFFDVLGSWDPSLAFVMAGALAVFTPVYHWQGSSAPQLDTQLHPPPPRPIDLRLVGGAALFGAGWGLAGFCPGPVVVSVAALSSDAFILGGAMIAGMALVDRYDRAG